MAVKHLFLVLLGRQELHGYELKSGFEDLAGGRWPLNFGQVYQTLGRLERDGLIESQEVAQVERPDKKVYRLTEAGRKALQDWLKQEEDWNLFFDELALKMLSFELLERDEALSILRSYRGFILKVIKGLTDMRTRELEGSTQAMLLERNIYRAEADLKWVTSMIERWNKYD
jgi:DNA-binding PadR family transcriptional regulator